MFELTEYLNGAVEELVSQTLRSVFNNPREGAFIARFALSQRSAAKRRAELEEGGLHVPPFLIASVASRCNLHCRGCYARATGACGDGVEELSAKEWGRIFDEAKELGVGFVLLAGGEPLMRSDVLEEAARRPDLVFPVFTNGTLLSGHLDLFCRSRQLIPVLSLEGGASATDGRRGEGVFADLERAEGLLRERGVFYGVSITVTGENLGAVTGHSFISGLAENGCGLAIFVEYVPAEPSTEGLALDEEGRGLLSDRLEELRRDFGRTVILSFPGDEKYAGGCLAAGRGFFHINASGGAEPCPFSPFSDSNLRNCSLKEALRSPLFKKLSASGLLRGEHVGGCVLFDRRAEVEALVGP